ncbi:MAG: HAMP domain-containing protein [Candidatus Latescibacteria bacterium]|nr:HAMP domain-containing protein [Candidatus Latescibacterota bacterium]
MRLNLLFRNFIYFALIIVFTTLIITIIASRQYRKSYLNTLELSLHKQAEIVSANVKDLLLKGKYGQVDSMITAIALKTATRITVIRSDGFVIGESDHETKQMEDHSTRTEFIQALQGSIGRKIRYSETTNQEMLYIAVPVLDNNEVVAVIRTSSYLAQIKSNLDAINKKIVYSAIVLTILALLLAIITSRSLTKPIRLLTRTAERIKNGEFQTHIIVKRKDEVGRLTEAVNKMAESLNDLFTALNSEREEIKSILASMAEGLVVLNENDQIIMTNDSFKDIITATNNIIGRYYWQVIKSSQFSELVKDIKEKTVCRNREIDINNNIYTASGKLIENHGQRMKTIIVLHDITEAKKLEQVKADFIANVSHELKTPLTSIKGFADTLSEEVGKKYQKFAETISRNADRLINIVQDLLVISELERKQEKLQIEPIDLSVMLNNLKKIFSHQLKAKKIKLVIAIADEGRIIQGDNFLIEQALTNLIDNAIKYNIEKGKINIGVDKIDNKSRIIVEDTGIGIAEEHLSRIFERFYVVDKSRSRKLGGTGLGLSIVKHIVLSHNGEITVENAPGKGTKFIITLPGS